LEIDAPEPPLAQIISRELERPTPPQARAVADAIREQIRDVESVLFYGSCLRKQTAEGVLDFYVLVGSYRAAYDSLLLAAGNAILPPNVFYIEVESEWGTLRAKYAVLSSKDFERMVSPACPHPYIWARFSQPALLPYSRDAETRAVAVRAGAEAVTTLIQRLGVFLPATGKKQKFSTAALWQEAFRRTYGAEHRPESDESIRSIYTADKDRYDEAARLGLEILHERGWYDAVTPRGDSNAFEVEMPGMRRSWGRLRWNLSRPVARLLHVFRLLKTAFTFGDWLPYAVWKMERHTGESIVLSERQRRRPLIFAWPVIWRVLLRR
jgi:hypothetical protein